MDKVPSAITERYSILETLRSSGVSRLFRARQNSTGQEVAVKLLAVDPGNDHSARDSYLQRFRREARFCADLHHPNIVPLVDFGEVEEGQAFAVFTFVPGMDLGSLLATEGALQPVEALHLMMQVVDALSCAHARGIVHRDLKPENIMINATGARRNALVLDFGIGTFAADWAMRAVSRLTETGQYLGTPAYSAPEQLRGAAPDLRSDLYTWGIIFLELLTGRPPSGATSPYEVIHRHLSPDPIAIPAVLEGTPLGEVLRLVTSKKIDDRTMSAGDVLAALQAIATTSVPSRADFAAPPSDARGRASVATPRLSSSWLVPLGRNPNFTGREQLLLSIHDSLQTRKLVAMVALHGLGGVGKSQLALEFAYRHASDYRLVAWIHAEQPESIAAGYAQISRSLNLPEKPGERETLDAVRLWFERNEKWLLVFDNVRDPASIRAYIPRWHGGHILVTSRHQGWRDLAASISVDVLGPQEAVDFLLTRTGEVNEQDAAELNRELGGLPLALDEAAAYIEATGRTIASYIPLLRAQRERTAGQGIDLHGALRKTWELSFREVEQLAAPSSDLLKICAFLAPDDIPNALFHSDSERSSTMTSPSLNDELTFDACIATLRRYSLIRREGDSLAVHRLVQLATRERLSEEERARWTGFALSLIEATYPARAIAGDSVPGSGRLLPHALSVLSHPACDEVHPTLAARVLRRTGVYMSARGLNVRAREQLEHALTLFERAPEPDSIQIGGTLWELGMVLYALGEAGSARDQLERAIRTLDLQEGPAVKLYYPQSLIALAWVQRTLGEFDATIVTAKRCMSFVVENAGPDHPLVAMSLALMARAEWSLNRLAEARTSLTRALTALQQVKNPLPLISGTWYTLGQVYLDLGELDRAFDCATRGYEVGEPAYGSDHPLVCLNVRIKGGVHLRRGDLGAARRDLQATIENGQRCSNRMHEDIAIARSELASVLHLSGDSDAAFGHLQHALTGLGGLCGDPARVEGQTRFTLANVLRARGEWTAAVDEARAGLRAISARYGETHPLRIAGLNALGWALQDGGSAQDSAGAFSEAIRLAEAAELLAHPDSAESLEGMGVVCAARGDHECARQHFTRALGVLREGLGDSHAASLRVARRIDDAHRPGGYPV